MTTHVWVGPSLSGVECQELLPDAIFHPPIASGALVRVDPCPDDTLVIIDGVYWNAPALQLPEIMWAMKHRGARVIGTSSLGALRAADLHTQGMVAYGTVAKGYASGSIYREDEVAVLHLTDDPYTPLTIPLVNLRLVCEGLIAACALSATRSTQLLAAVSILELQQRTWLDFERAAFASGLSLELELVKENYMDFKQQDALECLTWLARDPELPLAERIAWSPTIWWERRHRARHETKLNDVAPVAAYRSDLIVDAASEFLCWWRHASEIDLSQSSLEPASLSRIIRPVCGLEPTQSALLFLEGQGHDSAWLCANGAKTLDSEATLSQESKVLLSGLRRSTYLPLAFRSYVRSRLRHASFNKSQMTHWIAEVAEQCGGKTAAMANYSLVLNQEEIESYIE